MTKLTDWYSASIRPRRRGLYEVRNNVPNLGKGSKRGRLYGPMRYWTGQRWLPYQSATYATVFGKYETHEWRGLAADPRVAK